MRAGARSIGRDVAGRVKSTLGGAGGGGAKQADVWETATTEELTEEPPECQWCPICRAARRYRESGGQGQPPGFGGQFGGQFGGMGDTLAGLTRDAFSLFDAAVRASQRPPGAPSAASGPGAPRTPATPGPPAPVKPAAVQPAAPVKPVPPATPAPRDSPPSDHGAVVVGPGVGWPAVVHPEHQDDEAADEGGDRQEGGQTGDGGPGGGTDEQVERTAE